MKRLSKLIIALVGVLSLTSCLNLIPGGARRRSESSSINRRDNSNISFDNVSNNGAYSINGPRGNEMSQIGDELWWSYSVTNNQNGESMIISDYSYHFDGNLNVTDVLENDSRLLTMRVTPYESGVYYFKVALKIDNGETFVREHRLIVNSNDPELDYYVDYQCEVRLYRDSSRDLYFRAWDRWGNQEYRFDSTRPFYISGYDNNLIDIYDWRLEDDNRNLVLSIRAHENGFCPLNIELDFDDGSTFDVAVFVSVAPDIWLVCNDDLIIDYGESIYATFEVFEEDPTNGRTSAHLNPDRLYIETSGGFGYEIVDISGYRISLIIKNLGYGDYGNITFYYFDAGCYYEWGTEVISEEIYIADRWPQADIGRIVQGSNSSIRISLQTRSQSRIAIINSVSITSRNGLIPDLPQTYVYSNIYEYTFVPTNSGSDEILVTIIDENDNMFESWFYINITR